MLVGTLWGCLFYSIAFAVALGIYRLFSPWYKTILPIICFCGLGHFLGTYFYALVPSDSSLIFFQQATPHFYKFGTPFVQNLVWYVRDFLTEDSYLGTLYFFSAFAYVGSVLWYLLFLQYAQWLQIDNQNYILPALVIMCWPSFLFFTTGMGKDSLSYFFLPLIFIAWNNLRYGQQNKYLHFLLLSISIIVLAMLRPYLILIFMLAYLFSTFSKAKLGISLVWTIVLLPVFWYAASGITAAVGMTDISMLSIGERALRQQELQSLGTNFPMISHDPLLVLLFLPYSFVMNLFFPLFLFAKNAQGFLASVENIFLVLLTLLFWKKRNIYVHLKTMLPALKFLFLFFIAGMAFMALINTNLGLATRQKSMYLPPFFILTMLVWLQNKVTRTLA